MKDLIEKIELHPNSVGLVAHWKSPLISATKVADYSGNKNHGTITGSVTNGYRGFVFDGASFIDTGSSFQSTFQNSFTISAWVKPDDGQTGSNQIVIGTYHFSADEHKVYFFISSIGAFTCQYTVADVTISTSATTRFVNGANAWNMATFVATKVSATQGYLTAYWNGAFSRQGITGNVVFGNYDNSNNPYLGGENADGSFDWPFAGKVDDVFLYSKALTAPEIQSIYNLTRNKYNA